jgi:hypothetical protein
MPTRYSALAAGVASLWLTLAAPSSPAEESRLPEFAAAPAGPTSDFPRPDAPRLRLVSDDAYQPPRDDAYHPPHPPSYYSPYGSGPPRDDAQPQRSQSNENPNGGQPGYGAPRDPQRPQAYQSPYGQPGYSAPRDDAYHPPRPPAYESPYGAPAPPGRPPAYAGPPGYGAPPPPSEPGYGRPYAPPGEAYNDPGPPPRSDGPPPGSYSSNEILEAGHTFFGSISKGLASVIEYAFQKQGRPNGYILGQDAGGAFVAGLRFGEGTLYTRDAGTRRVYWQGPSIGWDAGAEGSKVMMLVYNLTDPEEIYQRFGGIDGSAYLVGGAGLTFQKSGDVIVAPIRAGVGLRLGANIGYLKYTRTPTWNPF